MAIIYGTKIGMTRVFQGDVAVPVTVIECAPNEIVQIKSKAADNSDAAKIAVGGRRRNASKAVQGEYKKAGVEMREALCDIPLSALGSVEAKAGAKITVAVLDGAKLVDVTGVNKGRGFAGVMKRHNFGGHKATHGTMGHRTPGSVGCRMDPGRTFKGQRMAGHWGVEQVTVKNLAIVAIDSEKNLVVLKGAVPGPNGGLIAISQK